MICFADNECANDCCIPNQKYENYGVPGMGNCAMDAWLDETMSYIGQIHKSMGPNSVLCTKGNYKRMQYC